MATFSRYIIVLLVGLLSATGIKAQDSSGVKSFKYVVLRADRKNSAVPDYQKFRTTLREGVRDLLVRSKVPMLKYPKDSAEKNLHDCDTLICAYTITYATGMMLNAKVKCSLTFTDCRKREVYITTGNKMTGAVAGADAYLKVFARLITPELMKHLVVGK